MFQKYTKILAIILLSACRADAPQYGDVPFLELKKAPEQFKLNGRDSMVKITLSYTDGDGDIGLEPSDTFPPFQFGGPYFYNLFIGVIQIENGMEKPILIPLTTDTLHYNDRIGNLTPTGKNKSISGELQIMLKAEPYPGIQPDSMYYTIQLADRKLHKSNLIKTPVLRFEF